MRKNRMMRLASVLLVCVLLSTSVISGTFAKYVTTASGTDTARIAKWGVTITANGDTFSYEYAQDDTSYTITSGKTVAIGTTAESDPIKDVVAPGTKGDMVKMTLSGTPEVAVRVNYTGSFDISRNWQDKNDKFYCPLIITISKGETKNIVNGAEYTSEVDFEKAVNDAIKINYQAVYEPNIALSSKGDDSLSIHWEWPFSTSEDNDVKDTYLGNQAAQEGADAITVTVAVTTTVTQID